jgi:2-aminophenol/2-amino-5-chlorophenol 1,6-dioxygenase beta subunit
MADSGKILAGFLAPHPPHLVYGENPARNEPRSTGGWEMLRWAYEKCREKIKAWKPDVILVHSPHWMTIVGHHFLRVPHLQGVSVDPIFPHIFRYRYDMDVDVELADACHEETRKEGLVAKKMTNPNFRVDYGTIVSLHMLNPDWDIPILGISANNSPYFYSTEVGQEQMIKLGRATARAIAKTGKRVVVVACTALSARFFTEEIDPGTDRISRAENDVWNRRVLDLIAQGKNAEVLTISSEYARAAVADMGFKAFAWLMGVLNTPATAGNVLAYGPIWGTGAAVVEYPLT